jgi:methionyl aminopeptidase
VSKRVEAIIEGGRLLAGVKHRLASLAKPGVSFEYIDQQADTLLRQTGGEPSFKKVPDYYWSTCINVNDGIVHGIPKGSFRDGDLATIDVGLFYKGYHTDTSISFVVGQTDPVKEAFLQAGRETLTQAIAQAVARNTVWDISHAIQTGIEKHGYSVVRNLTGHGVGKNLHEDPAIPCFTEGTRGESESLYSGQSIAVEVMYCQGSWRTTTDPDNWTIRTADGKLSAVFEETVIVRPGKPEVITALS